ncbi:hypothetical protein RSJ21_14965 [Clostridium botulinum]|uniref:PTS system mannose/fructose/sorbose family transporter subunit IID n=1 Tax=Clostridium botulinum TaxID=1491 RepID=UPI000A173A99|nr:PTS system mannose/fructose/sorbose family transporter subunit IID [Clostridium botulinum]AUN12714.1 hypothetical protein RSJ6_15510 [Clostridium botulinum]AUN23713.1 hypothetical protein RSJ22_15550 [Clostridium botulinum]AUN27394.1 hypothetical protein RSJ21_14965 [Clostridium botulinum]NFI84143.1 PTS mannose/fructose/sorbose transporter family subunit IID [Clostridium botulinum]OSA72212.1 hypothetical protein B2H87_07315 [Clostridium botulinum]
MAKELKLTKKDRISVWLRSFFLQGSWNYERMQNGGWAFAMIPAIKKLYKTKEDRADALKRHLEFFNTHPYVASPVLGVTLALEEQRANGAEIDDITIQGVKVGMMGPLAGIGDPVFWFTVRSILGALVNRWVSVKFTPVVSSVKLSDGAFIDWSKLPKGAKGIQQALLQQGSGMSLTDYKVTTFQDSLDSLIPGLAVLIITFICVWLLKKKVSPITIILGLFAMGIVFHLIGLM